MFNERCGDFLRATRTGNSKMARHQLYRNEKDQVLKAARRASIHHYLRATASHLIPAPCSCISIVMQRYVSPSGVSTDVSEPLSVTL